LAQPHQNFVRFFAPIAMYSRLFGTPFAPSILAGGLVRIIRVGCVEHAKDSTIGVFCKPTCRTQSALASITVLRAQRTTV
jgi:hypothetical protein